MKRFASVFVLAILLAMTMTWTCLAAAEQSKDNTDDETAELRKLHKEQIATLTEEVEILTTQYQAASVGFERLFLAQMELCDAKLDAADTPKERIAVLTEQLKLAESAQQITEKRHAIGAAGTNPADVMSAKSLCLKIKIGLVRERGKQKTKQLGLQGNSPRAAEVAKPAAQKFEYLQRNWFDVTGDPKGLDELGDKGWGLCGLIGAPPQSVTVVFKRPKQ